MFDALFQFKISVNLSSCYFIHYYDLFVYLFHCDRPTSRQGLNRNCLILHDNQQWRSHDFGMGARGAAEGRRVGCGKRVLPFPIGRSLGGPEIFWYFLLK